MSRIGKKIIPVPKGVTIVIQNQSIEIKGPAGTLSRVISSEILVKQENGHLVVSPNEEVRSEKTGAFFGLTRTLIANMVRGVVQPWKKELEIQGVGFRASKNGQILNLQVGYSHPVNFKIPEKIQFTVDPKQTLITMTSPDNELLGNVTSKIRSIRPPEVYKGKGIRYLGEHITRKAGKAAGAVGSGGTGGKK